MKNEYEIIPHKKIKHINILFTKIKYRAHHFHSDIELFCVVDGMANVVLGENTYKVQKGDIILMNPDEIHEIDAVHGSVCALVVQISKHFLLDYLSYFRNIIFKKHYLNKILGKDEIISLWDLIMSFSHNYISENDFYELETIEKISKLIRILIEKVPNEMQSEKDYLNQKKIASRMNRIVAYIDENYSVKLKLSDIAKIEKVSTTHLSHFFTQNFGITFQEYLNKVRFEHAIRLIVNKSISIFDVALGSGFSDPKYLARIFKKKYGCTPAKFREAFESLEYLDESSQFKVLEQYYTKAESLEIIEGFSLS